MRIAPNSSFSIISSLFVSQVKLPKNVRDNRCKNASHCIVINGKTNSNSLGICKKILYMGHCVCPKAFQQARQKDHAFCIGWERRAKNSYPLSWEAKLCRSYQPRTGEVGSTLFLFHDLVCAGNQLCLSGMHFIIGDGNCSMSEAVLCMRGKVEFASLNCTSLLESA
jgi:hypothetical protein